MIKPVYGKHYEITLPDGTSVIYRYDGYGKHVKPIWFDTKNGDTITDPAYIAIKEIHWPRRFSGEVNLLPG
jgi:hypothetical protein